MALAPTTLRRFLPPLCAFVVIGVLFVLSRQPTLSTQAVGELASPFQFSKLPLPELPNYPVQSKYSILSLNNSYVRRLGDT